MSEQGVLKMIPVDKIDPLDILLRKRVDEDYIRELALSIKEQGLLNPVTVRLENGRYRLVAGYCRWLAHKWLGRDKILSRIKDINDKDMLSVAAVENLQRKDLDPLEEAIGIRNMMEGQGLSVQEVAKKISKSESWIRSRLETLTWPENFLSALADKLLSHGALKELVEIEDSDYRDYLLRIGCDNGVTGSVARGWMLAWRASHVPIPQEDLSQEGVHVERAVPKILLPCWGCGMEKIPHEISYKPLCERCVGVAMGTVDPETLQPKA